MKGFERDNLLFSLCGLNCGLCPMQQYGHCPGCGGGDGNQSCAIARCSLQHGVEEYCFSCSEFPCKKYDHIDDFDSFITHKNQFRDIEKAKAIGIATYNAEQLEKINILKLLLKDYNDGRRKTFFSVAVNLMELQDLKILMKQITTNTEWNDLPVKEKTICVVELFQNMAAQQNIKIVLRKKGDREKSDREKR